MTGHIYHNTTMLCLWVIGLIWGSSAATKRFADRSYFALNSSMLAFAVVDAAWGMVSDWDLPVPLWGRYLLLDAYFFLLIFSMVTLAHYLAAAFKGRAVVRWYRNIFLGYLAATAVLLLANHYTGWLYTVDLAGSAGGYQRGTLFPLLYGGMLLLYVVLLAPILLARHRREERLLLLISYTMPLVVTVAQYFAPSYPFFSVAFMFALIGTTLTVEYQQRRQLMDALAQAEQANRAKTIFLSSMSHDIRTPMNAIIGFTALASAHADDPAQVRDYLHKISISGEHLLSLINDVLDMSRIESGRVKLEEKQAHLPEMLDDLRTIAGASIEAKNIAFSVDTALQNEDILCDRLRLNQILLNLLSNAVKYTQSGGTVAVCVRQEPCARPGCGTYVFQVKDNGIGMSEEFQKHLFEAFTREETATVSGIQGTGLGMAITKKLVDMMGGTIQVDSAPGRGTEYTVELTFPLAGPAARRETAAAAAPDFHGKKVLLVEDNPLNQEIAQAILEQTGFTVALADDGDVAVEKLRLAKPGQYDLVLMDIQMPKLDGYAATRQIRTLPDPDVANIPIVAMTANAFEDDRRKAIEAGMNDHIAKPVDAKKLRETLGKVLG